MRTAKWIFRIAAIYGIFVTLPLVWSEAQYGAPQARLDHPEFYYGFAGVVLAWQVAFLIIGSDPVRFRMLMLAAIVEKATALIFLILWSQGRVADMWAAAGTIDLTLGVLFALAWWLTRTVKA